MDKYPDLISLCDEHAESDCYANVDFDENAYGHSADGYSLVVTIAVHHFHAVSDADAKSECDRIANAIARALAEPDHDATGPA